jgi:hypothetical protein
MLLLCVCDDESYKKVFWGFHNNCGVGFSLVQIPTRFRELGLLEGKQKK